MRRLRKFLGLTWAERLLLLEAWLYLGGARAALLLLPFRKIAPQLGRQVPPDQAPTPGTPSDSVARVATAVETMSFHTPWESACLAQAIAAKLMLRRRGFPSMLYLGTRKDEDGKLAAHAWLRAGSGIVVGGGGHETFTALSAFDNSENVPHDV